MLEIYNESIRDLLDTNVSSSSLAGLNESSLLFVFIGLQKTGKDKECKIRKTAAGTHVDNLVELPVESELDVIEAMRRGNAERWGVTFISASYDLVFADISALFCLADQLAQRK